MRDPSRFCAFWRLVFLVALALLAPPHAAPHVRAPDAAPRAAAWTVDPPRSHATIAPRWTPFVPYRRTRAVQRCASTRGRTARPAPRPASERAPSPITSSAALDLDARQAYIAAIAALQGWALRIAQAHADAPDDPHDIAQTALLAALENFDAFAPDPSDPPQAAVRRWLAGILEQKRLMARRFRLTRGEVPLGSAFAIDAEALRHPGHEGQVQARSVLRAMRAATTPERWGAFYQHAAEGRTAAENRGARWDDRNEGRLVAPRGPAGLRARPRRNRARGRLVIAPLDTTRGRTWRPALRPLAGRRRPFIAAGRTRSKVAPSGGSKPRETPPARSAEAERVIALALMRYVPDLIRWARRCGVPAGDAPDVAQEVALRAWRKWETSERATERRAPWLFTFVARAASRFRRRAAKRPLDIRDPGEMEHAPDETALPDDEGDERAGLASLEQLRAGTTPERWRVFFSHEIEGVAVNALAKREGIPLGTAYNRLRLARRDLAATIAREAAAERTRLTLARSRTTRTKGRR